MQLRWDVESGWGVEMDGEREWVWAGRGTMAGWLGQEKGVWFSYDVEWEGRGG